MATKKIATKTAPKGNTKGKAKVKTPTKPRGEGGSFDRSLLKTNWTAKQVAEHRALHHGCKVGKTEYPSVYKAFLGEGLPVWQHQAFRKVLKLAKGGRASFTFKGKAIPFTLIGGE